MSYKCIIGKVETSPIPGCDNIQLATAFSMNFVVGIEIKDQDLCAIFLSDGQLSQEFAEKNDLIQRKNPETGAREGGMFPSNRRVRAVKLRGVRSEGFVAPLRYFQYAGFAPHHFYEGMEFDELNGHPICNKYVTPQTLKAARGNQQKQKQKRDMEKLKKLFPEHCDTSHFEKSMKQIKAGDIVYVSEKCEGTSHRVARINIEESRFPKLSKKFKFFRRFKTSGWVQLDGTRHVILVERDKKGFYDSNDFRYKHTDKVAIHKNEVIYGEIVGYQSSGKPIMPSHDIAKLSDKSITKRYGKNMTFSYGCEPGESKFFVYRIATVNEDGVEIDLPWCYVVKRCKELGLETVPLLAGFIFDGDYESLRLTVESHVGFEGVLDSTLDSKHFREGVVLRVESEDGTSYYKSKNFYYKVLAGIMKDNENYEDMEEAS